MTSNGKKQGGSSTGTIKKGYQPPKPPSKRPAGGDVTGGYQPTKSKGSNPANKPPPKKP